MDNVGTFTNITQRSNCPQSFSAGVGGSANIYQWFKDGILLPGKTSVSFSIPSLVLADAGAYTCSVTSSIVTGLTIATRASTISVLPAIVTTLSENVVGQLCNVKHLVATPPGLFAYQWYLDGKKIAGATLSIYDAYYSGNYTVTYQPDATSCSLTTPILAAAGLYTDPPPAITSIGTPISQLSTNYVASSLQWYVNGKVIANGTFGILNVSYNGNYYLVARLANNCQYRSNTIAVNESKYTDLARLAQMEGDTVHLEALQDVNIFPNPAHEIVNIDGGQYKMLGVEFFDNNNKSVFRKEFPYPVTTVQVDISSWPTGIYIISLWSDEKRIWRKLVK